MEKLTDCEQAFQMANNHMKRCLALLVMGKFKWEQWYTISHPLDCQKNREYQGLMRVKLHGNRRNMLAMLEIGKISLGSNWKYLTEVTMNMPLEPGLPLGSKNYSRETLAYVQKERHKNVQFQHFI